MSLAAGTVLGGRYRVLRQLGVGGMGSVYQVEDLAQPGTIWALKELLDDAAATPEDTAWARRRFDEEITLMRLLVHPRIPRCIDTFTDGGRRCFVMEFIPGATLEERLAAAHGPLPERDVLRWMLGICDVLGYLHGQRPPIIVRDLKPANIMVTPAGDTRLIDFGIARTYKPGKIGNTENLGTMTYASPEHLGQAQTDARSDIYSLGATMFHLLTNHEPAPMETPIPGSLRRHAPALDTATEALVIRAMQLGPERRFQSAAELRDALARCLVRLGVAPATPATQSVHAAPISLATAPVPAVPAAAPVATQIKTQTAARPTRTAPGITCPRCGFFNRRNARFCARDGAVLQPAEATIGTGRSAGVGSGRMTGAPITAALSLQRATEAFAAGRYMQTVRQCESATAQGRGSADVYLLLGRAQHALARHREAASAFAEAARLQPATETLLLEGAEWRAAGQPAQALVALTRARQLDPGNAEISLRLGLVCLDLGQLAQAEGELRETLAAHPNSAPALVGLGRVAAARGAWQQAVEEYRKALAIASANANVNAEAHLELGRALLVLRRLAEAVRALEQAARLAPESAEAQKTLGIAYHASGQRTRARGALQRAVALDPRDAEVQSLLRQI